MGKVIVVTSGKGGVGKTTSTAAIGAALAQNGDKVVVVDFDVGLRNLDLVMGAERRVVYDLINVIQGEAKLAQALIRDKRLQTLYLLPASQTRDKDKLTPDNNGSAFGEGGNDVLRSASGAVLRGDEGADKLHGDKHGKHKDVFWLQALDATGDTIFKFAGNDRLKINGGDFGVGSGLDGSELVNRSSGHDATEAKSQLIYDQSSKTLWLDKDGTGGGAAIKIATFKSGPGALSTGDFDIG